MAPRFPRAGTPSRNAATWSGATASAPRSWILGAVQLKSATGCGKRRRFPAHDRSPRRHGRQRCSPRRRRVRPDGTTSFSLIQKASDTGNNAASRLFPVRSPPPRWRSGWPDAGYRAERTSSRLVVGCRLAAALQRSPDRARAGFLRPCLHPESGRDRLEAGRCALRSWQSRPVGESQMPESRGIRGGRLDRS